MKKTVLTPLAIILASALYFLIASVTLAELPVTAYTQGPALAKQDITTCSGEYYLNNIP